MNYREYLQSVWWRCRRYQALTEADWCCQKCGIAGIRGDDRAGLEVHHLSYEHLGAERSEELTVLCSQCHADTHGLATRSVAGWTGLDLSLLKRYVTRDA